MPNISSATFIFSVIENTYRYVYLGPICLLDGSLKQGGEQQKEKSAEDQPKDPGERGFSARRREGSFTLYVTNHASIP